jgi:hypothetical protein
MLTFHITEQWHTFRVASTDVDSDLAKISKWLDSNCSGDIKIFRIEYGAHRYHDKVIKFSDNLIQVDIKEDKDAAWFKLFWCGDNV